jgi:hypothetical protein
VSLRDVLHRVLDAPPRNVSNGDLISRVIMVLVIGVLAGLIGAQSRVPYPVLKVALLIAAELGVISLMLGLFLKSSAYFAGVQLLVASLTMLWLVARQLPWAAIGVGLIFIGVGISNVATRRSRLNAVLALSSPRLLDHAHEPHPVTPAENAEESG